MFFFWGGVLKQWVDQVSSLDLWPESGRRHQLRRHLAMLGSPILGRLVAFSSGRRKEEALNPKP